MFSDPIKIPTFQVVTAIEGDTLLVSPKKKRGRPSKLNPFEKASEMVKYYVDLAKFS